MKFIYNLNSVTSPMRSTTDSFDMDYDDVRDSDAMVIDNKPGSLVERNNSMSGMMMNLSTCPTYPNEHTKGGVCSMKPVDTDDVASANGHYTLEDFFTSYRELTRNESIGDIAETGLDFSKLYGQVEEGPVDNPFQSLIDLVKCEIPADLSAVDIRFPKEVKAASPVRTLTPDSQPCKLVVRTETHTVTPKPKSKPKKSRKSNARSDHGTKLIERDYVNSRKVDYGANDTIENLYDLEWHPGFTRHLGAKGRSALLELLRRVYRQDPEHYKAILQSRNSPSSISSLPFFSIPMLWELAHQFGIFKQALTVYKNHCFTKSKSNRFYGFGRGSQTSASSDSSDNYVEVKKEPTYSTFDPTKPSITTMSGRLVKRSKKILEYTPDSITDNLSSYVSAVSSPGSELNDKLQEKLEITGFIKTESPANSPSLLSAVETKLNQVAPDASLVWKLNVVTRASNCHDSVQDGPLSPNQSLQRRISV